MNKHYSMVQNVVLEEQFYQVEVDMDRPESICLWVILTVGSM